MSCPDEQAWSEYADGEAAPEQAQSLAAHLRGCGACCALQAALARENGLLRDVMAAAAPVPALHVARHQPRIAGWGWACGVALLSLGPLALAAAWDAAPSLPKGVSWLKGLLSPGGAWSLSRGVWAVWFGGDDMLVSLLSFAMTLTVVLAALGFVSLRRPVRVALQVAAVWAVGAVLTASSPALAADVRSQEHGTVRVAAEEVVNDSVFMYGETAIVSGVVKGDLFVAAERVELTGTVHGNVYGAAETLTIAGEVQGSVHALGEHVELNAPVGGMGFMAGENVLLGERASLAFGGFLAGETVRVKGRVGRDLYFGARAMDLAGSVEHDVRGWASRFAAAASSSIGGDLHLTLPAEDAAQLDQGAQVAGKTHIDLQDVEEESPFPAGGFFLFVLAKLLSLLVFGWLALSLFPRLSPPAPEEGRQVLQQMGTGFVVLIATPAVVLILVLTVIGLPVAALTLVAYMVLVYASTLVLAYFAAERMRRPEPLWLRTALALLVLLLLFEVPLAGSALCFLATVFGMGALAMHLWAMYQRSRRTMGAEETA